ncbi:hypothetical protein C0995_005805, partial [Termitomyces sp. Mi166
WHGVDSLWVPVPSVIASWEDKSGNQLSRQQFPLALAWAITIHKSQGLTLDEVIIDLGSKDFSSGLSFVAISCVKTLKGLAFHTPFGISQLQHEEETESMKMLREDNARHAASGFNLNTYGMDLSEY